MSMTPHKNDNLTSVLEAESEVILSLVRVDEQLDRIKNVHEGMNFFWRRATTVYAGCSHDDLTVENMLRRMEVRPDRHSSDGVMSRPDLEGEELRMYYRSYRNYDKSYNVLIESHVEMVESLVQALDSWQRLVARQGSVSYLVDHRVAQAYDDYSHLIPCLDKDGQLPRRPRYE